MNYALIPVGHANPVLHTISSDGHMIKWHVESHKLIQSENFQLKLDPLGAPVGKKAHNHHGEEKHSARESMPIGMAGGCTFHFNPHRKHLCIVGTEEVTHTWF